MDAARLSRFPHLSWFQFGITGSDGPGRMVVSLNGRCHTLGLVRHGRHDVRWITRGQERRWTSLAGAVHFLPVDDERHTFLTDHTGTFRFNTLVLPRGHVRDLLAEERHEPRVDLRRLLQPTDAVLRDCIARVFDAGCQGPDDDLRADEAARRLVLRLTELCGGGTPDWQDDTSPFDRRTLDDLVARIDAHLHVTPSLGDMALVTGLSPSHFARKFRQSTGLSLQRFVNRRRVRRAFAALRADAVTIAGVAHDLGFCSQSHFTRIFSDLTGMTPARYRRQFTRTVG